MPKWISQKVIYTSNSTLTIILVAIILSMFILLGDLRILCALILGLLFIALSWHLPLWATICLLFVLPFQYLNFTFVALQLTVAEISLYVLVGVLLIRSLQLKERLFPQGSLNKPVGFLALWIFISFVWMCHEQLANGLFSEPVKVFYMYVRGFMIYFVLIRTVRSNQDLYTLMRTYVVVSAVIAVIGISQIYFPGQVTPGTELIWHGEVRAGSTTGHPTSFAFYLSSSLFFLLGFLMIPKKKVKFFDIVMLTVIIVGILVSGTRGAWVSITATFFFFFLIYSRRVTVILSFFSILTLLILTNYFPPALQNNVYIQRAYSIADPYDGSRVIREKIGKATINMLLHHPIAGVGVTNYKDKINDYAIDGTDFWQAMPWGPDSHNWYLQILSTIGLVGFLLTAWVLFSAMKISWHHWWNNRDSLIMTGSLGLGLFLAIINAVIYAFTANLYLDPFNLMAYVVISMAAGLNKAMRSA